MGFDDARADITAVVLAGGRGQRMDGADKGLLLLHGMPLAEHALRRLRGQAAHWLINANRNLDRYRGLGVALCSDAEPGDFHGPLAGIASALRVCHTPWLLCVPCDAPHLPSNLAERLLAGAQAAQAPGAIALSAGLRQPVFCLLRRELLGSLQQALASGERKVGRWAAAVGCVEVDFPDPAAFLNINAPAELAALQDAHPGQQQL